MKKVMNVFMILLPFVWIMLGIFNAFAGQYDRAAYDMAAGAFFMIMPMYYSFLKDRED